MLQVFRQSRRRAATRFGMVFASVWLAFAAVPCSALEQLGVDLGHTHAQSSVAKADHACPHCPSEQPSSATPGDCTGLDDAVLSKVQGFDLTLAAPAAIPTLVLIGDAGGAPQASANPPRRPPAVPLNLRYCTFLE